MKHIAKVLGILSLILWGSMVGHAEKVPTDEIEVSRKIEEEFRALPNIKVNLKNKYGRVEIQSWKEERVKVEVEIIASGGSREQAQRTLDRVEIVRRETESYFSAVTEYKSAKSSGGGVLSKLQNAFMGTQTAFTSSSNLNVKVNYKITLPEEAQIELEHKFGDVVLSSLWGTIKVDLAHGNLQAYALHGRDSELRFSYGDAEIESVNELAVNAKFAKIYLEDAREIRWEGVSSDLQLVSGQSLELLKSKKDRIEIQYLQELTGATQFSRVIIDELSRNLNLNTEFGRLEVDFLKSSFETFDLSTQSTEVAIRLSRDSYYQLDVDAPDDRLSFPDIWQQFLGDNDPETENKIVGENRAVRGVIGQGTRKSQFLLRGQGGHIQIQD